jgi:hypothetical protein
MSTDTDVREAMARAACVADGDNPDIKQNDGTFVWENYTHETDAILVLFEARGWKLVGPELTAAMSDAVYEIDIRPHIQAQHGVRDYDAKCLDPDPVWDLFFNAAPAYPGADKDTADGT